MLSNGNPVSTLAVDESMFSAYSALTGKPVTSTSAPIGWALDFTEHGYSFSWRFADKFGKGDFSPEALAARDFFQKGAAWFLNPAHCIAPIERFNSRKNMLSMLGVNLQEQEFMGLKFDLEVILEEGFSTLKESSTDEHKVERFLLSALGTLQKRALAFNWQFKGLKLKREISCDCQEEKYVQFVHVPTPYDPHSCCEHVAEQWLAYFGLSLADIPEPTA